MEIKDIKGAINFSTVKEDSEFIKQLQQLLVVGGFYNKQIDGVWGEGTDKAIKDASSKFNLNNYEKKKFGKSFFTALEKYNDSEEVKNKKDNDSDFFSVKPASERSLTLRDYKEAASLLGVETEVIQAVAEVESSGDGFLRNGKITILFEAHIFSQYTNSKFNKTNPDISSSQWNRALYLGGEREYTRLDKARLLDENAALMSCSYGSFQIMGFNYKMCGYSSVKDFVRDQHTAKGQIKALVNFISKRGITQHLKDKNWAAFAKSYNGSGYLLNKYDTKLANAYRKFKFA